jgi:hypothetical protein
MPVAPGIQDRVYGDPTSLSTGDLVKFFVQEHQAQRSGLHHDVRLGNKNRKLFSWAVRKGLPKPGEKHLGKQTFLHDEGYGAFSGELKSKYGRGIVKSKIKGKALITNVDNNGITFVTTIEDRPQKFRIQKVKNDRNWLIINVTSDNRDKYKKIQYKQIAPQDVETLFTPANIIKAKVDGSATIYETLKDQLPST